jgi:hypothetical protein
MHQFQPRREHGHTTLHHDWPTPVADDYLDLKAFPLRDDREFK